MLILKNQIFKGIESNQIKTLQFKNGLKKFDHSIQDLKEQIDFFKLIEKPSEIALPELLTKNEGGFDLTEGMTTRMNEL